MRTRRLRGIGGAVGALVVLTACTGATDATPETTTPDMETVIGRVATQEAWDGLPVMSQVSLCHNTRGLDEAQIRLVASVAAPDIDVAELIVILDRECR